MDIIWFLYLVDIELETAVEFFDELFVAELLLLGTLLWWLGPGVVSRFSIAPVKEELEPLAATGFGRLLTWFSELFGIVAKAVSVLNDNDTKLYTSSRMELI